jgi:ABC-2 type transport system permease protein
VRRYARLYGAMVRAALQREIEFRANFWAKVIQNVIWMGFFLLILKVFYNQTDAIAGWSEGKAFLLMATCYIMAALTSGVFGMGLQELPTLIRLGTMDYVLVKPVDTQFWISVRLFSFDQIGSVVASIGMLVYGFHIEGLTPSLVGIAMYIVLVIAAVVLFYSLFFGMMTLGIWLVRVENLWVVGEAVFQVARFPMDIFPFAVQRVFLYVVPLAFIATVPTRTLWGDLSPGIFWLGVGWSVVAFAVCRWFWRFALRYYTSASS